MRASSTLTRMRTGGSGLQGQCHADTFGVNAELWRLEISAGATDGTTTADGSGGVSSSQRSPWARLANRGYGFTQPLVPFGWDSYSDESPYDASGRDVQDVSAAGKDLIKTKDWNIYYDFEKVSMLGPLGSSCGMGADLSTTCADYGFAGWAAPRSGASAWGLPAAGGGAALDGSALIFAGDFVMCDVEIELLHLENGDDDVGVGSGQLFLPPDGLLLFNASADCSTPMGCWSLLGGMPSWAVEPNFLVTANIMRGFSVRSCDGCINVEDDDAPHYDQRVAWPLGRARAQRWQLGAHSLLFSGRFSGPFSGASKRWWSEQEGPSPGWPTATTERELMAQRPRYHRAIRKAKQALLQDMWRFSLGGYATGSAEEVDELGRRGRSIVQCIALSENSVRRPELLRRRRVGDGPAPRRPHYAGLPPPSRVYYPAPRMDAATWVTLVDPSREVEQEEAESGGGVAWMFGGVGYYVGGIVARQDWRELPMEEWGLNQVRQMVALCDMWSYSFASGWHLRSACARDQPLLAAVGLELTPPWRDGVGVDGGMLHPRVGAQGKATLTLCGSYGCV
jgi:hypothetical protein